MSPLDLPFGLTMAGLGAGAFVGFFLFIGVCVLIERIRR